MRFLIADTFTDSLTRLTADEQKAVKTTAFDLQTNPAHPSLKFHRLDRARDKDFWSIRAGRDIRLIVHKSASTLVLCYAGHHDKAYAWAERRKLTTHPTTGADQLVEIRELKDGRRALLAYTALDRLLDLAGDRQPWVLVRTEDLGQIKQEQPYEVVIFDLDVPASYRRDGAIA